MSTLLKNVNGNPFLHMTSDSRTVTQLEGSPNSNTVFHSDLPYALTSEQFEITSYTEINKTNNVSGTGARVFDIPTACRTFRSNNARRLYFVVLYDQDGGAIFHYPMLNARYELGLTNWIAATASGAEYQVWFDNNNYDDYEDAYRIGVANHNNNVALTFKFDRWETTATKLIVSRSTALTSGNLSYSFSTADQGQFSSSGIGSASLDIVRVRIVFLNMEVTTNGQGFNQKADFSVLDEIQITDSSFDVGNYDLANNMPIRIIETTAANQEIDDVYGEAVTFKRPSISVLSQNPTYQKKTVSGVDKEDYCTDSAGCVVVDIPRENTTNAVQIDLKNQTVKRNRFMTNSASNPFVFDDERTATVFSSTTAGSGMRVVGTRSLTFKPSFNVSNNQTTTHNLTSYTTAFTEDVFYIATLDMFGEFTGAHFITEGDNIIWKVDMNNRNASQGGTFYNVRFNFQLKLYLQQLSDSRVRARMRVESSGWTYTGTIPVNFITDFHVALLAVAR